MFRTGQTILASLPLTGVYSSERSVVPNIPTKAHKAAPPCSSVHYSSTERNFAAGSAAAPEPLSRAAPAEPLLNLRPGGFCILRWEEGWIGWVGGWMGGWRNWPVRTCVRTCVSACVT